MKYLFLFLPFFSIGQTTLDTIHYPNSIFGDSSVYFYALSDTFVINDCPSPQVIAWDYFDDTITITQVYWERDWEVSGFLHTYKCVEKVRKFVFKGEWVQTIHGYVESEKIIPKKYKF